MSESNKPKLRPGAELWVNSKWYADVIDVAKGTVKLMFSARDSVGRVPVKVEVPVDSVYLEGGTSRLQHVGIDEDILKNKMGNTIERLVKMGDVTDVMETYSVEDVYDGYPSVPLDSIEYGFVGKMLEGKAINRRELSFIAMYGNKRGLDSTLVEWARVRLSGVILGEMKAGITIREARPMLGFNGDVSIDMVNETALSGGYDPLELVLHIAYVNEDGAAAAGAGTAGMGAYTSPGIAAPGSQSGTAGSDLAVGGPVSGIKGMKWQRLRDKGKELVDYRNSKKDMAKLKKMRKTNQVTGSNGMYNVIESSSLNEGVVQNIITKAKENIGSLKIAAGREVAETKIALNILGKLIKGESITDGQRRFLKAQAGDLGKILGHIAVKFIPVPVPITPVLAFLQKKTGISFFPKDNRAHLEENYVAPPPTYDPADEEHYDVMKDTGYFGAQAAGCVFVSKNTGRFMLMLRSDGVMEPGTWGNCGGAHKKDEPPVEAAEREGREETGYSGPMTMKPAYVFRDGNFVYSNFFALVEDEFVPDLGWEADDYKWCTLDRLPSPLHFGVKALLDDGRSRAFVKRYEKKVSRKIG